MSVIHYGATSVAPPTAPPVKVPPRSRLSHQWIGADGSVWELSDHRSGVFLTQGAVRGMHTPAHTTFTTMTPALSGQRANGSRVLPRECAWPIHLYSDGSSEEWAARDQAWWASLDRDVPGVWRVTAAGRSREITLRFDESEDNFVRDPMFFGWSPYSVRLIADDPWWYGPWVSRQFDNGTQVAPFHAGPQGAVIHIGSSSQLSSASIDNPGDEPSYLVYLLHGPFESATVGIGGQSGPVTSYVGQVPDGQTVVIDTRPGAPSRAYMVARPTSTTGSKDWVNQWSNQTGQSVYSGLTSIAMNYPLQAGKQSPLSLQMVGAGSVEVVHRPPYRRAW